MRSNIRCVGDPVPGDMIDYRAIAAYKDLSEAIVDVDDQRFRIAVPNGFAKDWLETRYRSLISQTLARIVGYAQAEVAPKWLFMAPVEGVRRLEKRTGLPVEAFDLVELNEAFAAQVLADGRALGLDWARVNVNGGAIAMGHNIAATGLRTYFPVKSKGLLPRQIGQVKAVDGIDLVALVTQHATQRAADPGRKPRSKPSSRASAAQKSARHSD